MCNYFFPNIVPCNGGVHKRRRFKERERPEGEWGVEVQLKTSKKKTAKSREGVKHCQFWDDVIYGGPKEEVFVMSLHRSNSHEPLGKFDMVSNNQGSVHLWAQMKHEMAFGANWQIWACGTLCTAHRGIFIEILAFKSHKLTERQKFLIIEM